MASVGEAFARTAQSIEVMRMVRVAARPPGGDGDVLVRLYFFSLGCDGDGPFARESIGAGDTLISEDIMLFRDCVGAVV